MPTAHSKLTATAPGIVAVTFDAGIVKFYLDGSYKDQRPSQAHLNHLLPPCYRSATATMVRTGSTAHWMKSGFTAVRLRMRRSSRSMTRTRRSVSPPKRNRQSSSRARASIGLTKLRPAPTAVKPWTWWRRWLFPTSPSCFFPIRVSRTSSCPSNEISRSTKADPVDLFFPVFLFRAAFLKDTTPFTPSSYVLATSLGIQTTGSATWDRRRSITRPFPRHSRA